MTKLPTPFSYTNSAAATQLRKKNECCLIPHLYVSRIDLEKTHKGICFANYSGYFLNVNLTLNFSGMGFTTYEEIDNAYRDFEEVLRKKIGVGYKVPFFAYAVFECGPIHGCHVHIGVHVPAHRCSNFKAWLDRRIRRMSKTYSLGVHHLDGFRSDPTTSQWKWFSYLMKGLDPRLTEDEEAMFAGTTVTPHWLYGVQRYQYGGYIPFSRVRRSRSISAAAQKAVGYAPEVNLYYNESNKRYSDHEYRRGIEDRSRAEVTAMLSNMELI